MQSCEHVILERPHINSVMSASQKMSVCVTMCVFIFSIWATAGQGCNRRTGPLSFFDGFLFVFWFPNLKKSTSEMGLWYKEIKWWGEGKVRYYAVSHYPSEAVRVGSWLSVTFDLRSAAVFGWDELQLLHCYLSLFVWVASQGKLLEWFTAQNIHCLVSL